ncbi:hypothetical protein [Conchiformibius steedae]|uniref:Uncharacterized protein n=1 Tax=Conchiformibius steedae TaxID=153493 RepID=A0A3P2A8D5_9NEIS|nr:hypothetical protein [Conchiformibius steedae]RRD91687.1 hypothetical protein EII21_01300 [Conchiformibius steedae]
MKTLALLITATALVLSAPAQAAVKIQFAKGSYCGSYSGSSYGNKTFTLHLKAGQTLEVNNIAARYISTNPSRLQSLGCGGGSCRYIARKSGNHSVALRGSDWESVEFCAY